MSDHIFPISDNGSILLSITDLLNSVIAGKDETMPLKAQWEVAIRALTDAMNSAIEIYTSQNEDLPDPIILPYSSPDDPLKRVYESNSTFREGYNKFAYSLKACIGAYYSLMVPDFINLSVSVKRTSVKEKQIAYEIENIDKITYSKDENFSIMRYSGLPDAAWV